MPVVDKLCDTSLTRAIAERYRDEFLMIKRYCRNLRFTSLVVQLRLCLDIDSSSLIAMTVTDVGGRTIQNAVENV